MSWIDISIILVLLISIAVGYARGLVLSLASLLSFVISIVLANLFYKDLALYIINRTTISSTVSKFITSASGEIGKAGSWINGNLVNNLPSGAKDYINNFALESTVESHLSGMITSAVIHIFCFLLIFTLIKLIIFAISHGLNTVAKLPVLNFFNKSGGVLIGVLQGLLLNFIVVSVLYTIAIFWKQESLIYAINNSVIAPYFYIGYIFY